MNSLETPHILKFGREYYINKSFLFFIAFMFSVIIVYIFKSSFGGGIRLIVFSFILSLLINILFKKLGVGKIVELHPNRIILSKYPIGNFGIFRILMIFQIVFNLLKKIEVNYKDITKIYQKSGITNKGFYIEIIENISRKEYRIFLEILSDYDKNQIIEIINTKREKYINNA